MKRYNIILIAAAATLSANGAEPQIGTGETNGYKLVWQELFDAEELNRDRWTIEVNAAGGGNNELQFYSDALENVRLGDDGQGNHCLILTARREESHNRHFTSGRITSRGSVAFAHGKIEAAIKLPKTANGLWPAFWMMGDDYDQVGWPRCGEIDIMEFGNANGISAGTQERYFNGAFHWGPAWPQASHAQSITRSYSLQDGEFHLYTCIWTPEKISMYIDLDKIPNQGPYCAMNIGGEQGDEWSPATYFHKPNHILFNLAVGGNFTGIHDAAGITALNDENGQQASMYVNYLRIYQTGDIDDVFYAPDDGDKGVEASVALTGEEVKVAFDGAEIRLTEEGTIEIFDIAGKCVASAAGTTFNTSTLAEGLYICRATCGTSAPKSIKFSKK